MDIREIKDSQVIISNKPPIVKALNQPSESDIKAFTEYINGKLQDLKEEVSNFIKEFHATLWITSFIFTYITLAYMHKWMKYAYCSKNKEYLYQLDLIKEEFEKIKNWKWDKLAP